ncbi:MAG: hypothetical protein ACM34K_16690 [Bacillota bacterium]
MMKVESLRPKAVTAIVVINALAALITLLFWIIVYVKLYSGTQPQIIDKSSAASTLGFLVSDIIWAVPALIVSIPGLLKMKFYGWTSAQLANILWFYSMTSVFTRDIYAGGVISPGNFLFLPFTLISVWAAIYLWRKQMLFLPKRTAAQLEEDLNDISEKS